MPTNLAAAAVLATGIWAASAYSMLAHDGSVPRELWTVTSSDKNPRHPTLARATVPKEFAAPPIVHVARVARSQ